jgi:hypothetical protein
LLGSRLEACLSIRIDHIPTSAPKARNFTPKYNEQSDNSADTGSENRCFEETGGTEEGTKSGHKLYVSATHAAKDVEDEKYTEANARPRTIRH